MRKILQGLGVGVAAAVLAGVLWLTGALDGFEAKTWDWRVRLLARPGTATDQISLILLDQNSLDWGARENNLAWPWPREVYHPIIEFCRRQGARAIAFDVLFTEPSKYGVADDMALGSSAGEAGNFVAAVFLGHTTGSATNWPADVPKPAPAPAMPDADATLPRAAFPVPELATQAAVLANVYANPDADGVYRRIRPFQVFDSHIVPALGLGALLADDRDARISVARRELQVGEHTIPLDRKGRVLLRYRGPSQTHRTYSAAAVIESELMLQAGQTPSLPEDAFRDSYVFLGFSAPGLYDLRPTPVSGVYPGVEIHATLLDNILSGDMLRDAPRVWTILLILFWGAVCGLAIRCGRHAGDNAAVILITLPLPGALSLLAYSQGYWLPFLAQETAVILALAGGVLVNYATEGRQKRFIRSAFKQYLSEEVISQLVADPDRLTLGGEQRTLSIFFSDLQGFTGISEKLNPRELTSLLNEYLSAMTDIIQAEGGTVDKYEGDAIIAFWNAPLPQDDHAIRAMRATLQCQARLTEMRPDLKTRYGSDLLMRIGLNTGPVVVGNMGSHNRFNYTILGDAANLAARLEGINKQFGSYTLISESTREAIAADESMTVREISRVMVVGRRAPVNVYEPIFANEYAARQSDWQNFAAGLAAFYKGDFSAARSIFEGLQERDPPSAAYVRKCDELSAQPPDDWQGVWVMTEK